MNNYELMYIHNVTDSETIENFNKNLQEIIEENEGIVNNINLWGIRNLPYEIKNKKQGIYAIVKFQNYPANLKKIDRKLRLKEEILRFMIIRL